MGKTKQTVWTLEYKMSETAMPLYYQAPWNKEGKFPKMCLSFFDAMHFPSKEAAVTEAKALKEATDLDWRIEEHIIL